MGGERQEDTTDHIYHSTFVSWGGSWWGGEVGLAPQVVSRVIVVVVWVGGGLIAMRATSHITVGGYGCVWFVVCVVVSVV